MAQHQSVSIPSVKMEHNGAAAPEHPRDGQELHEQEMTCSRTPVHENCSAELRHFLPAVRGSKIGMFVANINRIESQRIQGQCVGEMALWRKCTVSLVCGVSGFRIQHSVKAVTRLNHEKYHAPQAEKNTKRADNLTHFSDFKPAAIPLQQQAA